MTKKLLITLSVFIGVALLTQTAFAAVAFDNSNTTSGNGVDSLNLDLTTTAANEIILVCTDYSNSDSNPVVSITDGDDKLNFVKMDEIGKGGGNGYVEMWRAFATSTMASNTLTLTYTGTNSPQASMIATAFSGVDTTGTHGSGAIGATSTANDTTFGSTDIQVSTTTSVNDALVVGCFGQSSNKTFTENADEAGIVAPQETFSSTMFTYQDNATSSGNLVEVGGTLSAGAVWGGFAVELKPEAEATATRRRNPPIALIH